MPDWSKFEIFLDLSNPEKVNWLGFLLLPSGEKWIEGARGGHIETPFQLINCILQRYKKALKEKKKKEEETCVPKDHQ